ncbi:ABC transporter substrate-binding protein [Loigolactobacillus jiayinensis]|uniref:ABC transporter substrate-binding protein n=1 Tax=Loigolactobacillus jiayinensis TaxID=2486016 RepID=A0ABW1RIJ7_9LACO|nr:ABC transporter substrate-binding protein [Loigolactobacillus jiayinensis]
MKKRLLKVLMLLLMIPLLVGSLAACSNSASSNSSKTTVKIGYMANASSVALAAIADQAGYYEQQGITVKMIAFTDGPAIISALNSGSIDIGNIGAGAHTAVAQGKAKVFLFDGLSTSDEIIGSKKAGTTSIKSLKGKKVAVISGTTSQQILDTALKSAGMTEDDVTLVNVSANNLANAMISGKVDAVAGWAPGTTKIKSKLGSDAVTIASDSDYAASMPFPSSWVTSAKFAKNHKALLKKITTAMYKAMDDRKAGKASVYTAVAKQLAISKADAKSQLTGTQTQYTAAQVRKMVKNGKLAKIYQKQEDNFVELGTLKDNGQLVKAKDFMLTNIMTAK